MTVGRLEIDDATAFSPAPKEHETEPVRAAFITRAGNAIWNFKQEDEKRSCFDVI